MTSKIFLSTIMHNRDIDLEKILTNTEQLLIHAETLEEAFGKLIVHRNYSNTRIIDLEDDKLLAYVEVDNDKNPIRYILLGEPDEILPRLE